MQDLINQLNSVQAQAVTNFEGPILVVAGPGSGKTRVLTFRIAQMIEQGVAPWSILALTFTNKAAREMKERIAKVVGDRANQVWAGTFHSIFARLLRADATRIGYDSNFTIYDSDDCKSLVAAIIKEMGLPKDQYAPGAVLSRISSAKSKLKTPLAYAADEQLIQEDKAAKRPAFIQIYSEYWKRCQRAGAMDFDDLLLQFYRLLQDHAEVRDKFFQRFQYLMVDEFQDTNDLQYAILKKLVNFEKNKHHGEKNDAGELKRYNICVVGDDAQSIYAFRGATIENILNFENDFKGMQTFKLEQNYRSTHHIVQAANQVITYNSKQIKKEIWTDKGTGQKIKIVKAMTDSEEGRRVADAIIEQKNRFHLRNSEIAILYRTNGQSRIFEESLRRYNVPYKVFGGMSFYQRKEVKDLLAYLRLSVNQQDEEALRRVINYPRRGIGDTLLDKLSRLASANNQTLWEALPHYEGTAREKNVIGNFIILIKTFADRSKRGNAHDIAVFAYKQSGLLDELKGDTSIEGLGRLENITALLDGVKEFVENDELNDSPIVADKTLASYLQNIALLTDAEKPEEGQEFVTLMSVHAAKGLEYKSVFVVGMEEKLFPSFMAETNDGMDEERRLFYVAITRAEQHLTLSYSASRYQHGTMRYNSPSRFLEEIDVEHLESTAGLQRKAAAPTQVAERARVSGAFNKVSKMPVIDLTNFKPSDVTLIKEGNEVLHQKFGKGKVTKIDGPRDGRVATIVFEAIEEPERRIMLRFAKLQIL